VSYILDALRKAERRRQAGRIPTVDTVHDLRPARSWRWPAGIAAVLLANAVTLYLALAPRDGRGPEPDAPPAPMVATAAPSAPPSSPPSTSAATPPPGGEPVSTAPMAPSRPSTPSPPSTTGAVPAPRSVPEAPQAANPAPAPLPAEPASRVAPPATAPVAPAPEPPAGPPIAPAPRPSAAAAPAPVAPAPRPSAAAMPAPVAPAEADASELRLEVHVYAERPADRMVFINGEKYVEGQVVSGTLTLATITPEGALLTDGSRRILLRP
jgi:general secretion pathway protein B